MTQDPFWHPVMGAVDFMTQDIIRQREARRRENLQRENWDRQAAQNRLNKQISLLSTMGKTPGITPESRNTMYGAAQEALQGNPPAEIHPVQVQTGRLSPEVADFYAPEIPKGKELPLSTLQKLEEQYWNMKKAQGTIATGKQNASSLATYRKQNAESLSDYRKTMSNASMLRARADMLRAKKYRPGGALSKTGSVKDLIKSLKDTPNKIITGNVLDTGQSQEQIDAEVEAARKYLDYLNKKQREATSKADQDSLRKTIQTFDEYKEANQGNQDAIIMRDAFIDALKDMTEEMKK